MPKLSEIATALRNVADALDKEPDLEVPQPSIAWYFWGVAEAKKKDCFVGLAHAFPRPFSTIFTEGDNSICKIVFEVPALRAYAEVPRKSVCELVEPAKPAVYRCEPLLSAEEEAEIQ
jgi:hypothetical protein